MKAYINGWLTDHPTWEATDGKAIYTVTLNQYHCFKPNKLGPPDNYLLNRAVHFKLIDLIDEAISVEKKRLAGTVLDKIKRRDEVIMSARR